MAKKVFAFLISFILAFEQSGFAQVADLSATLGTITAAQTKFRPVHMRYMGYDSAANDFTLFLDKGSSRSADLSVETPQIMRYFLTGISLPDSAFWVNLRPEETTKTIDPRLENTDLGRVLLAADVQLKKDITRLTSPDTVQGRSYWKQLYRKSEELFGNQKISIPTMARPWIIPGEIIIGESPDGAYIYKATLKVRIEQERLDLAAGGHNDPRFRLLNDFSAGLIKQLIVPQVTKLVNSSRQYADFRQAFYSLIMAQWFKRVFRGRPGVYSGMIEQENLSSARSRRPWSKDEFFAAYRESFKNGEYTKQESARTINGPSIRTYTSGGIILVAQAETRVITLPPAQFRGPSLSAMRVDGANIMFARETAVELPGADGGTAAADGGERHVYTGIIDTFAKHKQDSISREIRNSIENPNAAWMLNNVLSSPDGWERNQHLLPDLLDLLQSAGYLKMTGFAEASAFTQNLMRVYLTTLNGNPDQRIKTEARKSIVRSIGRIAYKDDTTVEFLKTASADPALTAAALMALFNMNTDTVDGLMAKLFKIYARAVISKDKEAIARIIVELKLADNHALNLLAAAFPMTGYPRWHWQAGNDNRIFCISDSLLELAALSDHGAVLHELARLEKKGQDDSGTYRLRHLGYEMRMVKRLILAKQLNCGPLFLRDGGIQERGIRTSEELVEAVRGLYRDWFGIILDESLTYREAKAVLVTLINSPWAKGGQETPHFTIARSSKFASLLMVPLVGFGLLLAPSIGMHANEVLGDQFNLIDAAQEILDQALQIDDDMFGVNAAALDITPIIIIILSNNNNDGPPMPVPSVEAIRGFSYSNTSESREALKMVLKDEFLPGSDYSSNDFGHALAAAALQESGAPEGLDTLLAMATRSGMEEKARCYAIKALGNVTGHPEVKTTLAAVIDSGTDAGREAAYTEAAISLARLNDPRGLDALITLTENKGWGYSVANRQKAIKSIGTLESTDPRIISTLENVISKGYYSYQEMNYAEAALGLVKHGDARGMTIALTIARGNDGQGLFGHSFDGQTRYYVIDELATLDPDQEIIDTLAALLDAGYESDMLRAHAASSLAKLGDQRGTAAVIAIAEQNNGWDAVEYEARYTAIKALGEIPDAPAVRESLVKILNSKYLAGLSRDGLDLAQAYAAQSLAKHNDPRGIDALIAMTIEDEKWDGMYYEGRYWAIQALGDSSDKERASEALLSLLQSKYVSGLGNTIYKDIAKAYAAESLAKLGDPRAMPYLLSISGLAPQEAPGFTGIEVAAAGALALGFAGRRKLTRLAEIFRDGGHRAHLEASSQTAFLDNVHKFYRRRFGIDLDRNLSEHDARIMLWSIIDQSFEPDVGGKHFKPDSLTKVTSLLLLPALGFGLFAPGFAQDDTLNLDGFDIVQAAYELLGQASQIDDNMFAASAISPKSDITDPEYPLYRLDPAYWYYEHDDLFDNPTYSRQETEAARGLQYIDTPGSREALFELINARRLSPSSNADESDLDYARIHAAISLHKLGDRRGTDALLSLASTVGKYQEYSWGAKYEAVKALGEIENDPRVIDVLVNVSQTMADSPLNAEYNELAQTYAAASLQKLGDKRGTQLLIAHSNESTRYSLGSRYEAIKALGEAPATPEVINALLEALNRTPYFDFPLTSDLDNVFAAISLHKLGDNRGTEALIGFPENITTYSWMARYEALQALGDIKGDERVIDVLLEQSEIPCPNFSEVGATNLNRAYAAVSLQKLGDYRGTEKLIDLALNAGSYSWGARYVAINGLGEAEKNDQVINTLVEITTMDSPYISGTAETELAQTYAAASLQKLGDSRGTERLIYLIKHAGTDSWNARLEALKALGDARSSEGVSAALTDAVKNPPSSPYDLLTGLAKSYAAASLAKYGDGSAETYLVSLSGQGQNRQAPGFAAGGAIAGLLGAGLFARGIVRRIFSKDTTNENTTDNATNNDGGKTNGDNGLGGIDLTAMQSATRIKKMFAVQTHNPNGIPSNSEWVRIKALVAAGAIPFAELRTYIRNCKNDSDGEKQREACVNCILGALRAEEDNAAETSDQMRDILKDVL